MDWILSVARDKTFQWCCSKTGRKFGSFEAQAWCTDVTYDYTSSYVFIADYGGQINVLKLENQKFQFITTLKGHQSKSRVFLQVQCVCVSVRSRFKLSQSSLRMVQGFKQRGGTLGFSSPSPPISQLIYYMCNIIQKSTGVAASITIFIVWMCVRVCVR